MESKPAQFEGSGADDTARPRRPGALRRTIVAWSVIGVMGLGALFIQPCGVQATADILGAATWTFLCPGHQAITAAVGEAQGS
jgi:hypothetical protein